MLPIVGKLGNIFATNISLHEFQILVMLGGILKHFKNRPNQENNVSVMLETCGQTRIDMKYAPAAKMNAFEFVGKHF